jgi:cob(I)alamin adenosyltransferase
MSIVTKGGDSGTTSLMYGRRVSKCDPRVEACGTVDELNSALGVARAACANQKLQEQLEAIQKDLVRLMGELATAPEDLARYTKDGFGLFDESFTKRLEAAVEEIESAGLRFEGWAMPGRNTASAALDMARAICRRAERTVCALQERGEKENPNQVIYLNRLSDLLWLMAREVER